MMTRKFACTLMLLISGLMAATLPTIAQDKLNKDAVRVFIFAGQSNMVGSDSKAGDIKRFPPFDGLDQPQNNIKFNYCLGRENKKRSDGWVPLQPIDGVVGPELSFARRVTRATGAPLAIIKCAAGGTHLGGDWNPDEPIGFKMYPLALELVRSSLAELERQNIEYRVEGFMWHQGENDMFNEEYMENYGKNLQNYMKRWREDLELPNLKFYVGELCTKTIWGMDLRPRMYAISKGQRAVTDTDPNAEYIPTSHIGVEIGGGVGLHYHYGTLGQLEHGENYAAAYLRNTQEASTPSRNLKRWPYEAGSTIKLFVLAGHRNMEGERAFIEDLQGSDDAGLLQDDPNVAYRYHLGGGYKRSNNWEPIGPAGLYHTFGPELAFADTLQQSGANNFAVAKFTHSGSQIIDWTPEGSVAQSRNLYPAFIEFVRQSAQSLKDRGHTVELAGVFYHIGENDMSWGPFRSGAAQRIESLITQSRQDLQQPNLTWYVSQQLPTDDPAVNKIDVTAALKQIFDQDANTIHIEAFDLPPQEKKLVLDTPGVIALGRQMAETYLDVAAEQPEDPRQK